MVTINKLELPRCPYCGEKLLYLESFLVKNKTNYECKCCDCFSEVVIKLSVFNLLLMLELAAIVIFLFSVLFGGSVCFFGIIATVFVFAGFYAFSPFSIKLCKVKNSRALRRKQSEATYNKQKTDQNIDIYSD